MTTARCARTLIALALAAAAPSPLAARAPGVIEWEPYEYTTRSGETITGAELGRLTVPERHDDPAGNTIELAFVRFRSTSGAPGPPIVWLAGGPGDHGSDDIEGPYLALVTELRTAGDVIALDQRGTGLSRPLLECPDAVIELPTDRPIDREAALDAYRELSRACADHFTSQGIDLAAYHTVESARDVDALRRALGVERVSLYGASYGTHLALAVLRDHEAGVHRVVLSGVEGPDHTWKLPSNLDAHFARVFHAARADDDVRTRYGDLEGMTRRVLRRLATEPVTITYSADEGAAARTLVIDDWDLRQGLGAFLGSRENISRLPAIMADLDAGRFEDIASYLARGRRVSVWSAMNRCMDCASGATPARLARLREEAARSVVGIIDWPAPAICDAWPHAQLTDDFRAPVESSRPTLFLSGTLDGHTPPSNADEVMAGFTDATRIVVDGGSHQHLELDLPAVTRRLGAFLRGETVRDTTFHHPIEFAIGEEPAP